MKENILIKSIIAKFMPIADLMETIISIILGEGDLMGGIMM